MKFDQQDLFISGTRHYHTYRIPALLATPEGTLLAFCEGRKESGSDTGWIDLLVRRSTDGGETWQAQQVVHQDPPFTIGNPAPLYDRETGKIYLVFCRNNNQVFVTESSDQGLSWKPPREITASTKRPNWGWYATGPVHGIQLQSGRLLVPCDHRAFDTLEEKMELDETLIDPYCQGSIIGSAGMAIFSNPASTEREKLTLRLSYDGCRTWPKARTLHRGPAAYSDLCMDGQGRIHCLFEGGENHRREKIALARMDREWLEQDV